LQLAQLRSGITNLVAGGQTRSLITVDVVNNTVDRALRTLKRKLLEEGFQKEWQANKFYLKPSAQRKLDQTETEKRLRKRAFKDKMRWIMKRGARYVLIRRQAWPSVRATHDTHRPLIPFLACCVQGFLERHTMSDCTHM
jgi:small subunit ribosomal protein S21